MGIIRKDFKYIIIKSFLNENEIELFKNYTIFKHRKNNTNFDFEIGNGDTFFKRDSLTQSLLLNKKNTIEKVTGLELWPTYSFWRMYTFSSFLKKHVDKKSCEISVTIMVGSDGTPWPIYMEDAPILMEPGDACIYLGCEINHGRDEFNGDWHSQIFLHYVDKNGPCADLKFDKQNFIY